MAARGTFLVRFLRQRDAFALNLRQRRETEPLGAGAEVGFGLVK